MDSNWFELIISLDRLKRRRERFLFRRTNAPTQSASERGTSMKFMRKKATTSVKESKEFHGEIFAIPKIQFTQLNAFLTQKHWCWNFLLLNLLQFQFQFSVSLPISTFSIFDLMFCFYCEFYSTSLSLVEIASWSLWFSLRFSFGWGMISVIASRSSVFPQIICVFLLGNDPCWVWNLDPKTKGIGLSKLLFEFDEGGELKLGSFCSQFDQVFYPNDIGWYSHWILGFQTLLILL